MLTERVKGSTQQRFSKLKLCEIMNGTEHPDPISLEADLGCIYMCGVEDL